MLNRIPLATTTVSEGHPGTLQAVPLFKVHFYCEPGLLKASKRELEVLSIALGDIGVSIQLFEETKVARMFNGAAFEQLNIWGIELESVLKAKKGVETILGNTRMSDVEEPQFEVEASDV